MWNLILFCTPKPFRDIILHILFLHSLICLANIVKLYKAKIYSVKAYKKASKGLKAEEIPFADLYANVLAIEPGRTEEWNAWGKEIVDSLTDPKYIQWYKQFLQL